MGCCQSRAIEKHDDRNRSEASPLPDICYPDKIGYCGVKVLTSSASASGTSSPSSSGRTYTRLVIGPEWIFAALFEAHGASDLDGRGGGHDAAARFCAEQCYAEFQRAVEATGRSPSEKNDDNMSVILTATLKALDRRFLTEASNTPQDRWASGCTAVLLHITLGGPPKATVASLGPCAAVVGQRRGGLASATSAPLLLCGGAANGHDALQGFLAAMAAEQRPAGAQMKQGRMLSKKGLKVSFKRASGKDTSRQFSELPILPGGEPEYSRSLDAPQALGFGCGKGMQLVPAGKAAAPEQYREARLGMQVQTASHVLGPADDCLVLLSGGAAASIAPADVALLMHRMGRLAGIPFEAKARTLRPDAARGPVAQLDNLGVAGPPAVAKPAAVAAAISPFNAARLLVHQATANVAARGPRPSVGPVGIMAFALEWPRSSDDSGAAAAAIGNSVSAVCATAAAAVANRQRAQYLWQLLRLYYKVPHKRRMTIINRWHEVFDRVVGAGKRTANLKETAAWLRLGAAVKVSTAGNVQCLSSREDAEQLTRTPPRKAYPAPRQNHSAAGGIPSLSPVRGAGGQRLPNRPPLSAAGASAHPPSPTSALSGTATATRSPSTGSTPARQRFQSLTPGPAGTPRCSSARESLSSTADAAVVTIISTAGSKVDPVVACDASPQPAAAQPPSRHGPVGLLEVEGIDLQGMSRHKLRGQEATDGGCDVAPSPSLTRASQKYMAGDSAAIPAASAADFSDTAPVAVSDRTSPASSIAGGPKERGSGERSDAFPKDRPDGLSSRRSSKGSDSRFAKPTTAEATADAAADSGASISPLSPGGLLYEGTVACAASAGEATSATAAMATRIPSRSAGGASASSPSRILSGGGSPASARSPRSRIPTLLLKPGPAGTTGAVHATPRLSMPGSGTPVYQPTPAGAGSLNAATANATPSMRGSNTWGGAAATTTPPSTAPNSARSGSSRLPRPPNLNTPAAVPATSPAGSVSNRSLLAGSDAGSIPRSNSGRPPRLEVPVDTTGPAAAAGGGTMPHGNDLDFLSPDADQLAAWAMEAVDALGASAKKPSPSVSASATPRLQQQPTSARSKSGLSKNFANGVRSGGVGTPSTGGVRSGIGSRIPLSPR
ncbi:hypothetical protein Vretimale_9164 [Volvox reticuliferus]|nr:hypothetical protein Vretimale_9164 [Volvox reticuliferus]